MPSSQVFWGSSLVLTFTQCHCVPSTILWCSTCIGFLNISRNGDSSASLQSQVSWISWVSGQKVPLDKVVFWHRNCFIQTRIPAEHKFPFFYFTVIQFRFQNIWQTEITLFPTWPELRGHVLSWTRCPGCFFWCLVPLGSCLCVGSPWGRAAGAENPQPVEVWGEFAGAQSMAEYLCAETEIWQPQGKQHRVFLNARLYLEEPVSILSLSETLNLWPSPQWGNGDQFT